MTPDERSDIQRMAEAVADRTPVDWSGDPVLGDRNIVENLRALDLIGSVLGGTPAGNAEATEEADRTAPILPAEGARVDPASWGPLLIKAKIGEGGFGEVFLAHDPDLEKDVALKLRRRGLSSSRNELFIQEARKLARVRHPNVLAVHGVAGHDGRAGIWADYIEGRTLDELLDSHGPFGAEEAIHVGVEVCRALAAVHAAGLVHGDVKGSNVKRETGGRLVLMDFSAAIDRLVAGKIGEEVLSGTPLHMSPELFAGHRAGVAADIYALGVVLYRLVSGRYPVEGKTLAEVEENRRAGRVTPLRDVAPRLPGAFISVVERALEPNPEKRFRSAGEMERALLAIGGGEVPGGEEEKFPEARPWRRRWLWAAAGAVLVAGALAWSLWPRPLEVEASLFRTAGDSDERLQPGARVGVGDQLFLEIEGSRKMNVYVINEDEEGRAAVLFPLPDLDLKNPLEGGARHRLPGDVKGVANFWDVTSVGGAEKIVVIASPHPLPSVEEKLARIPQAGSAEARDLGREVNRLRGIAGLSPHEGGAGDSDRSTVERLKEGLSVEEGGRHGIWCFEILLANPGGGRPEE